MKSAARSIAGVVAAVLGRAEVAWACRRARAHGRRIAVLDIDNTLADTWPTLTRSWPGERARLAALDVLPNMKAVAHDAAVDRGDVILFLTHRGLRHWPGTYRWLRRHEFAATPTNVVLVAHPRHKLAHLRRCVRAAPVTYWDDLSHSHERGEVAFYDELVAAVRSMPVDYLGWDDIRAVVERSVRS